MRIWGSKIRASMGPSRSSVVTLSAHRRSLAHARAAWKRSTSASMRSTPIVT